MQEEEEEEQSVSERLLTTVSEVHSREAAVLDDRINDAVERQRPYLGQRCHVNGVGFGTIVDLQPGYLRVEIDAGVARWYRLDKQVELLATYPAG
jgi:hypothetical protein